MGRNGGFGSIPVEASLAIVDGLHQRWTVLLKSLDEGQLQRTFMHPERGQMTLDLALAMYAWHCRHHTAHIVNLRRRMGW